jgi:transcriptional/translational regulatory protein YebC/TACO1
MENLKSNVETLEALARDYKETHPSTSRDLEYAAFDIKLLKDQVYEYRTSQEKLNEREKNLSSSLFEYLKPQIKTFIAQEIELAMDESQTIDQLVSDVDTLRDNLDSFEIDEDSVKDAVRDLFNYGDVSIKVEVN